MRTNSITRYIKDHWNGELTLRRSFFLNGVLLYLLLVILTLAVDSIVTVSNQSVIAAYMILFLMAMIWSLVGIARAAIKVLLAANVGLLRKAGALIAIIVVARSAVALVSDLRNLL